MAKAIKPRTRLGENPPRARQVARKRYKSNAFGRFAESFGKMASLLERATVSRERMEASEARLRKVNADLAREINERKRAEDLFRLVVASAPNGMLMIDRTGNIVLANAQIERMFEYAAGSLVGKPLEVLIPERYRHRHPLHRGEFLSNPQTRTMGAGRELFGLRQDGSEIPVEIGLNPIDTPEGVHVLASVIDITERKAAEHRLQQSEERFRLMIENIKDHAIVMLDLKGQVLTWNKGAAHVRGFEAEEIIGKNYACFFTPEDRAAGKPDNLLNSALRDGLAEDEGWRVRKDGSRIWAGSIITAVRNSRSELTGFSLITRDLTSRMKMERELTEAKQAAERADQAKSAFLATISHEIRTPMTGVLGMTGLLLDTELSPEQKEYCQTIRRSGETLLTIINEVLDFSKAEFGKLELECIEFNLRSLVEEVMNLFAKQAEDHDIEFINSVRGDVPDRLRGDPGRLRQILSNLISNALKFTTHGEVTVRVTAVEQTQSRAELRFEVQDTGIGIAEDKVGKLFDAFTQVDPSTTRKYGGTGLGLAICKKFVDLMGGQVGVTSAAGQGSTFWFSVAFAKQTEWHDADTRLLYDHANLRVLLTAAHPVSRKILADYLAAMNATSKIAEDVRQTLEALVEANQNQEPFDVVILDFRLDGGAGLGLAKSIRANKERFGSPKLLLLTSVGMRGDANVAKAAGIDGYLTKPVGYAQLADCLSLIMRPTSAASGSQSLITAHNLNEHIAKLRFRVLVADDNHINQKVVSKLLENFGHRADVVSNGKEAVAAYSYAPYDVILMDLSMPEMDGFEASRAIRKLATAQKRQVFIIAITAHALKEDRERCIAAGMDGYLAKPINPAELKVVMAQIVAAAEAPKDLRDIVDRSAALSQLQGDSELLNEITRMYVDQCPMLLDGIRSALVSSDYGSLADCAHTLGSSAGQIGAMRALAAARKIEELCRGNDLEKVSEAVLLLEAELTLVEGVLANNVFQRVAPPEVSTKPPETEVRMQARPFQEERL